MIITTAYRDYAIEGYELNVIDYLVKPINFNRFLMAVNKLKDRVAAESTANTAAATVEREHLFFNVNKKKVKIYVDEILYVESLKEYVRITASGKSIMTKFQLGQIEEMLARNQFIRVHRSFLVAIDKIDHIEKNRIRIADQVIPISDSYADDFHKMLKGFQ